MRCSIETTTARNGELAAAQRSRVELTADASDSCSTPRPHGRWLGMGMALSLSAAAAEREKLIVLPILAGDDTTQRTAKLVEEQVLTELARDGRYEVAGQSEIAAVIGIERQRELLGCLARASPASPRGLSCYLGESSRRRCLAVPGVD